MRRTGSIYECLVGLGILVSSLVSTVEARPFFFFSCLLIRGSGLTLTLTRKQMAKSVQSRRRRHKTDYRSVRAGRNARVGFLRRKKTERHAMTWCPWRGPLIGSTTSASSDSYDGRDKPHPHTYCRPAFSFCLILLQLAKSCLCYRSRPI